MTDSKRGTTGLSEVLAFGLENFSLSNRKSGQLGSPHPGLVPGHQGILILLGQEIFLRDGWPAGVRGQAGHPANQPQNQNPPDHAFLPLASDTLV